MLPTGVSLAALRGTTPRAALALTAAAFLAGCGGMPIMPGPGPARTPPPPAATSPAPIEDFGVQDPEQVASGAEQACVAAGRERGLDVVDVVGSSSVTTSDGEAARDVMLRVRRSGAEIEVRCNYVADTGMARIMLI